jgi:hypothetical protein
MSFDESQIMVTLNSERRESVRWDDLTVVGIRIQNEGFIDTPYWILAGKPGGCVFPSNAVGNREILAEMQKRLPGFSNVAVLQAMGMSSGGVRVWERESVSSNRLAPA